MREGRRYLTREEFLADYHAAVDDPYEKDVVIRNALKSRDGPGWVAEVV